MSGSRTFSSSMRSKRSIRTRSSGCFNCGVSLPFPGRTLMAPAKKASERRSSSIGPRPSSAGRPDPKLIADLVAANRILAREGVLDGWGHVSVRHNLDPNRYLLSRSLAPELVSAGDIIEFDLDNNPVNDRGRNLYTERFIHGEIYKTRPDVVAICHSHAPPVIPFGVTDVQLKPMYHRAAFIALGVPIFEIREAAGMTDLLIRNAALGRALATSIADKPAVLMRGHGATIVAPTLPRLVG